MSSAPDKAGTTEISDEENNNNNDNNGADFHAFLQALKTRSCLPSGEFTKIPSTQQKRRTVFLSEAIRAAQQSPNPAFPRSTNATDGDLAEPTFIHDERRFLDEVIFDNLVRNLHKNQSINNSGGSSHGVLLTNFRAQGRFHSPQNCLPNLAALTYNVMRRGAPVTHKGDYISQVYGNKEILQSQSQRPTATGNEVVDGATLLYTDGIEPWALPGRLGTEFREGKLMAAMNPLCNIVDALSDKGGWPAFEDSHRHTKINGKLPGHTRVGSQGLVDIVLGKLEIAFFDDAPGQVAFTMRGVSRQEMALFEHCLAYVRVPHPVFIAYHEVDTMDPQLLSHALSEITLFPPVGQESIDPTDWDFPSDQTESVETIMNVTQDPEAMFQGGKRLYVKFTLHVEAPHDGKGVLVTTRHLEDTEPHILRVKPLPEEPCQVIGFLQPGARLHVSGFIGLATQTWDPTIPLGSFRWTDHFKLLVPESADRSDNTEDARDLMKLDGKERELGVRRDIMKYAQAHCPTDVIIHRFDKATRFAPDKLDPSETVRVMSRAKSAELQNGVERIEFYPSRCIQCGRCVDVTAPPNGRLHEEEIKEELVTISGTVKSLSPMYTPRQLLEAAVDVATQLLSHLGEDTKLGDYADRTATVSTETQELETNALLRRTLEKNDCTLDGLQW